MTAPKNAPFLHLCPQLVARCDVRGLPLTVRQAYVWSRIDGTTSPRQIADLTAFDVDTVIDELRYLAAQGAIVWPDDAPVEPLKPRAQPAAPPRVVPASEDPALDEPGDLPRDERLRLLTLERSLRRATYWEVLGADIHTTPAELKRKYHAASKAFHPDRYYGKTLGSFGPLLERLFALTKKAYDALGDEAQRKTYAAAHPPPDPAAEALREARLAEHREELAKKRRQRAAADQAERATRQALQAKNLPQARLWAERAVQAAPDRVAPRLLAAEVCLAAGDLITARKHGELAASLDGTDVNVKNFMARLAQTS